MRIEADWVTAPASVAVMDALDGQGFFVGGCVRNALFDQPVADIDIATPLVPDDVIARVEAAGLRAVPTGLHHGTVTAVFAGNPVEVTTFRTDIETDGRHAVVRYTTDMTKDAGRRDFTMNALYADRDGTVIDPLGGLPDVEARRVRFIDDPHDRIREDYLRILRFFRFHAWYGADGIDEDGLAACAELAEGIDGLARERIGWEFRKLLAATDPAPAVASMAAAGVLLRCLPGADPSGLAPLIHAEAISGKAPDWITRLYVLGGEDRVARLRLARTEKTDLDRLAMALDEPRPAAAAYRHGASAAYRAALVRASVSGANARREETEIERGAAAEFPLKAQDLIDRGIAAGPALGRALAAAEERWIESDFAMDRAALLAVALGA